MTEMNNMDFFEVATLILEQVLSYHYVSSLKTWGATGNMDMREGNLQNSQF